MDKRFFLFAFFLTVSFMMVQNWMTPPPQENKEIASLEPIPEKLPEFLAEKVAPNKNREELYVLENNYQQLVFSSNGGSLVEINLPLSTTNPESIIRPIHIDKELENDAPRNEVFPLFPAYQYKNGSKEKLEGVRGGYYPLLRRDIVNSQGDILHAVPESDYSLNVIGRENSSLHFSVKSFSENSIVLQASQSGRKITKTYSFPDENAPYCFYLTIKVEGDASNLWLNSGIPEVELISGSFTPELKVQTTQKNKVSVERLSLPKEINTVTLKELDWIANSTGFFVFLMDPLSPIPPGYKTEKIEGKQAPTRLSLIDEKYNRYPADKYPGYQTMLPLKANEEITLRLYAGPLDKNTLVKVDKIFTDPKNKYNPNYAGAWSFHGWFSFISEPFAKFLFWLMQIFFFFTRSWGFSIILLTVALKVMMYPLNAWSIRSMQRVKELTPKLKEIEKKYKNNPQKKQQEQLKLYREKGANPFMGCFPMLLQFPFLIGMFDLLKSTFALRGASFIPGWIDNLTAPDILFQWDYPFFFIGNQFHLLPILLGVVMWIQAKITRPDNPNPSEQEKQQAFTGNFMAIFMTALFYHFPSGLNLYWLSSTVLGILQHKFTKAKTSSPEKGKR